VIEDM